MEMKGVVEEGCWLGIMSASAKRVHSVNRVLAVLRYSRTRGDVPVLRKSGAGAVGTGWVQEMTFGAPDWPTHDSPS